MAGAKTSSFAPSGWAGVWSHQGLSGIFSKSTIADAATIITSFGSCSCLNLWFQENGRLRAAPRSSEACAVCGAAIW